MEQNEWIYTVNKYVVLSFSSPRCTILSILTSLFFTRIYIFLTQYRRKRSYTRAYTHLYERTHAHPTPMSTSERLSRHIILRFTKSPQAPRHRPERLLSLKAHHRKSWNKSRNKCEHQDLNPGGLGYHCPSNHPSTVWFTNMCPFTDFNIDYIQSKVSESTL